MAKSAAKRKEVEQEQATPEGKKLTRNRAFLRSYDYDNGQGAVKDALSNLPIVEFSLSQFPQEVIRKAALSGIMALIAARGVEAIRDKEDPKEAMEGAINDLANDKVEFRDGVGIAMGGMLKKVARALVELGYTHAAKPDGVKLSWHPDKQGEGFEYVGQEGLAGAFEAMRRLWDTPEVKVQDGVIEVGKNAGNPRYKVITPSGRVRFNKIKSVPEVAAKVAQYTESKPTTEEESALG